MFGIIHIMLNVETLIQTFGLLGIGAIILAETGLLLGFFLPGDTLLFVSGFFASQGKLPLGWLLLVIIVCAIIGDNIGYSIGRRTGHRIFKKKDGIFFRKDHLIRAEKFYKEHGGKTIIMARFVPVVRTFAPLVAGVGKMPHIRFTAFNIVGAMIWGLSVTLLGYFAGGFVDPNTIELFIIPVFIFVTLITFGPGIYHLLKDKETRSKIAKKIKLSFNNIFSSKKTD